MLAFFSPVKGLERGCDCIFRQDEGLRLDEYAAREEVVRWAGESSRRRPMVAAVPRAETGRAGQRRRNAGKVWIWPMIFFLFHEPVRITWRWQVSQPSEAGVKKKRIGILLSVAMVGNYV